MKIEKINSNEPLSITFSDQVNSYSFEITLKRYYSKSKNKLVHSVCFDFSNVTWCDIFELSQISL